MNDMTVRADSRGRVSLARAGVQRDIRYAVTVEDDGTIRLTPAVVVRAPSLREAFGSDSLRRLRATEDRGTAPLISAEEALGAAVADLEEALTYNAAHRELATVVEPAGLDAFFDSLAREQ